MTNTYTPAELRNMVAEATPGPWDAKEWTYKAYHCLEISSPAMGRPLGCVFEISQSLEQDVHRQRETARLIAQAPTITTDLAAALEEIERLREALEMADAALSGANMDMRAVERKVKAALAASRDAP